MGGINCANERVRKLTFPGRRRQHNTKVMIFCLIHPKVGVIGPVLLDDYSEVSESIRSNQEKYRAILDKCLAELRTRAGSDFDDCWFH